MSDIPVEDIAHRLKKAIKKLTTQQVEALIEVIDAIVTETKKESRAQAIDECVIILEQLHFENPHETGMASIGADKIKELKEQS